MFSLFRCLPFYGNTLPRPPIGIYTLSQSDFDKCNHFHQQSFLRHLHYFITSYAVVLVANFTVVFWCMAIIYCRVFQRIRRMIKTQRLVEQLLKCTSWICACTINTMQGTQRVHLSLEQHGIRYWRDRRGERDKFFFSSWSTSYLE